MFAIEVDLLVRRYTARAFDGSNASEWPPHPARLYSAMVAAWADADEPDDDERSALRWFESLEPPSITCAGGSALLDRAVVTHYVPVNDARSLKRDVTGLHDKLREAEGALSAATGDKAVAKAEAGLAKAIAKARADAAAAGTPEPAPSAQVVADVVAVLPESRGRQPRTFPTVRIAEGVSSLVRYEWPEAQPSDDVVSVLDAVLGRVARLGHSSTFVSCRASSALASRDDGGSVTWRVGGRDAGEPIYVRVPSEGSLDQMARLHAAHHGNELRTMPAAFGAYRPAGPDKPEVPSPLLAGPWRVLKFPSGRRVRLTRTLDIARAVRGALLSGSGDSPPALLHGHATGGSSSPSDRPHLAVLPLANVGSPYGDGIVHGVALALPRGVTSEHVHVLDEALARWAARSESLGAGHLELRLGGSLYSLEDLGADFADSGGRRRPGSGPGKVLERWFWARQAQDWATVTPIALDRFPGPPAAPDWDERAAATMAASCVHAGLPAPSEVEVIWGPPMRGVPAAGPRGVARSRGGPRFGGYRAGTSGQVRLCVHARLRFDTPVRGPVVLGAGRYAGYGLCVPIVEQEPGS